MRVLGIEAKSIKPGVWDGERQIGDFTFDVHVGKANGGGHFATLTVYRAVGIERYVESLMTASARGVEPGDAAKDLERKVALLWEFAPHLAALLEARAAG